MELLGLIDIPLTWMLVAGCLLLIYLYGKKRNRFLSDYGIPGPTPDIYLGNLRQVVKMGVDLDNKWGQEFGDVYSVYLGGFPLINVHDPEIIKEIFIRDFNNFSDRLIFDLNDFPLSTGIFFETGATWKRLRNIISPTFSGNKLRSMCAKIDECAVTLTKNLAHAAENEEIITTKDYFGAFTMDVIASTAFGIDIDSQNNFHNVFITQAKKVFDNNVLQSPVMSLIILFPSLQRVAKALGFSSFPKSTRKFFVSSLKEMITMRKSEPKEEQKRRIDFLQLMLDAGDNLSHQDSEDDKSQSQPPGSQNGNKAMTTDEVLGQAFLFFIAGYETTASTLNFAAYSLATNPDVQERLTKEVDTVLGKEPADYDNIGQLTYMDHVISETLRLYPVVPGLNRAVSKTTVIKGWTFPKGSFINIPLVSLQRNADIFPEPNKFNPDRWENADLHQMGYLPFGQGPRMCIGMRLAQVEMKIGLARILQKVQFDRLPDTPDELRNFTALGTLSNKCPINLKVVLR
ncbi:cytochrome P450 3A24-like [Haliotis rufescens]|uniref:cytochrome P450 3A24-like n=1 Tax=Haliotis rufescens TaxID=6454 RepID=UPI00201F2B0C|nr:cytochrome P450 3A24-like [Haliotis rufescens]